MYKRADLFAGIFTVSALLTTGAYAQYDLPDFNELDQDGNGMISQQEAHDQPQLQQDFQQADANGDGNIDQQEYEQYRQQQKQPAQGQQQGQGQQGPEGPENPLPAFDELDRNNDGMLDREEAQGTPYEQRIRETDEGTMSEQEIEEYNREMYLPDEQNQQGG